MRTECAIDLFWNESESPNLDRLFLGISGRVRDLLKLPRFVMIPPPLTRLQLAGYLICVPLYVALLLLVAETLLSATTTYLVIKVARDIANKEFLVYDLFYILASQSASYLVGAASWIFSEMAGCRAFGLYMLRFAQDNRHEVELLNERNTRERVEPFLMERHSTKSLT
jgi:hypothetical protein